VIEMSWLSGRGTSDDEIWTPSVKQVSSRSRKRCQFCPKGAPGGKKVAKYYTHNRLKTVFSYSCEKHKKKMYQHALKEIFKF